MQQKSRDFQVYQKQLFAKPRQKSLGFPKFKRKSDSQSYRLPNQKVKLLANLIQLEKIGKVKMVVVRPIPADSRVLSATISKNKAQQYFVSICVEETIKTKPKTEKGVGVDLGLKAFATLSDGIVLENPRFLKRHLEKLRQLQRYLSRKVKNSKGWRQCRLKIARLHQAISNQRQWFLHHCTSYLVNHYDNISIEDLHVSGLLKNHKLAGAIADVSWSEFKRLLAYKCLWYGKRLVVIDRFAPSSKTCSACGWKAAHLSLKERVFECSICGLSLDRDLNAARNIYALGVDSALGTPRVAVTKPVEAFRVT